MVSAVDQLGSGVMTDICIGSNLDIETSNSIQTRKQVSGQCMPMPRDAKNCQKVGCPYGAGFHSQLSKGAVIATA